MYDVIDWELEKDVDIAFVRFSFVTCNYWRFKVIGGSAWIFAISILQW